MGLQEKRAQKDFVENTYPEIEQKILAAAKTDLKIEVDWDSLTVDDYAARYSYFWPKVYFEPLIKAFESITSDDMGKEALASKLKKIVIKNEGGYSSVVSWCTFEGDTLTLDHRPESNVDSNYDERIESLIKILENSL